MSDTEPIDAEHIAPLDNDNIPDANQSHSCFSCGHPMVGLYCTQCGQKNDNYRRSITSLVFEVFSVLTAIENRIWRTWKTLLLNPGKVAREFADGRRSHWTSPVRIYLAMSIILFGFMNCSGTQLISFDVNVVPKAGVEKVEAELEADDLEISFITHFFETQTEINRRNATRNFDLIARKLNFTNTTGVDIRDKPQMEAEMRQSMADNLRASPDDPRITAVIDTVLYGGKSAATTKGDGNEPEKTSLKLDVSTDTENTVQTLNINNQPLDGRIVSDFIIEILKDPAIINSDIKQNLPRIMFFMMPFTMFIGAIFIRGRGNALLYDHLVHAAYIHAVAFLLILLALIGSRIIDGGLIAWLIVIAMVIYLPLSLKTMFNRSWLKTLWTSYNVGLIYLINLIFILLFFIVIRMLIELGVIWQEAKA